MASPKSRRLELSDEERAFLLVISRAGSYPDQEVRRAWILLEVDESAARETGFPVARGRRRRGRRLLGCGACVQGTD